MPLKYAIVMAEQDIREDQMTITNTVDYLRAVSYTHLDVYKRQPITIANATNTFFIIVSFK